MENLLLFVFRSSLIVAIIYIFFQFIRNDTSFSRNRILLLSGIILAMLLPFAGFVSFGDSDLLKVVILSPVTINSSGLSEVVHKNVSLFSIVFIVYIAGVLFIVSTRILALFSLINLVRTSEVIVKDGYRLVFMSDTNASFSFFNTIFINSNLDDSEARTIIAHEYAHVVKHHSMDVIFMEILVLIQWFNPLVWLYRTSLREVHEYQADRSALNDGIEKSGYIRLLLAMALNTRPADLTNNFCQIKLKRRLKMITQITNSRMAGVKFMLIVPVTLLFLWLVACDNKNATENPIDESQSLEVDDSKKAAMNNATNKTSIDNNTDDVFVVVEDMPTYPGGDEARQKFIIANIKYPQKAKEDGVQGTVFVTFVVDVDGSITDAAVLRGIGGGCDEEALRVIKRMPRWNPGKQSGKRVKVKFNMPIKFTLS